MVMLPIHGATILAIIGLASPPSVDPAEVLVQARNYFLTQVQRLPNYTCVQTVNRRYFRTAGPSFPRPSCAELNREKEQSPHPLTLEATDRLRLDIKVSEGVEIGSWAGSRDFDSRSLTDLIGQGPYGTGPFGTLLWDIFASGTTFEFAGAQREGDLELLEYGFRVSADESHFYVDSGREWVAVAYRGSIWIDPASMEPRRVTAQADQLPSGSGGCETMTTADYRPTKTATGEFLLPYRSTLRTLMRDSTQTETIASYSACRQYVGEATLRFEGEPAPAKIADESKQILISVPPDLAVTLALTSPIDTDTVAAGDGILFSVRKAVRNRQTKTVVIPAGATVRGRIVEFRHWLGSPRYFSIAVVLEELEIKGASSPFYAHREVDPVAGFGIRLPRATQQLNVSWFVFPTRKERYVVPKGYESNWTTVPAPRNAR